MPDKSEGRSPAKAGLGRKGAVTLAGLLMGSVGAVGIQYSVGAVVPGQIIAARAAEPEPVEYVDIEAFTIPVVDEQGDLVRYMTVDVALEVPEGKTDGMRNKLPMILHEINMATWDSGLAAGPDGRLLDAPGLEKIVQQAARTVYGQEAVNRVLVMSAIPS